MDLHVPDVDDWAAHPRPVLLEHLPYRKDDVAPYSGAQHLLAQHGYIGARLDCRGTGSSADFPNLWPTPFPATNRVYRGTGAPPRLLLPVVPFQPADDEALPAEPSTSASPYTLWPDERPWELVHDVLGDRTGLRAVTRDVRRPTATAELTTEARLTMWASNRDPAAGVATGKHRRRLVRTDGTIAVDTVCTPRSTVTAFHQTIDLDVRADGHPHFERRWVRTFPRVLL
jgi:hypothetical protein